MLVLSVRENENIVITNKTTGEKLKIFLKKGKGKRIKVCLEANKNDFLILRPPKKEPS